MKNICFFNSISSWGGGEKWHLEMATYISKLDYKVLFFAEKNGILDSKIDKNTIKVEHVSVSNFSYFNTFKVDKVAKVLKENKIETIIFNSSQELKFAGLAAKKAGVKNIIYRRGSAIPIKNSFINRYFFSNIITNVLANSSATKVTINANNKNLFPDDKITVIPNGIETEEFLLELNKISKEENKIFTLGNLGRLVKQKNQFFLLDVAKKLKEDNFNFKLIIGGEGKLKEALVKRTKELQLENEVVFEGFVKNPKMFMAKLDVFLLSSLWEGFGYVIAEAMLCKKPVIAFNISSNPELVVDTNNGFLTAVNDVDSFVNNIKQLESNKDLISKLGKNGRHKIVTEFDALLIRKKFKKYIDTL
ncbi:glycosyltransferase [uncultured Polaribacter sp.]|uniref:glycosyltransferase n=1 Tax=uncultured Polaribacter sp. TaxID=174711 RepID=UPI0026371C97|nr:glycosyltransferase [uncultured Polaribacter sp.]